MYKIYDWGSVLYKYDIGVVLCCILGIIGVLYLRYYCRRQTLGIESRTFLLGGRLEGSRFDPHVCNLPVDILEQDAP